jgi:hypothetical protein
VASDLELKREANRVKQRRYRLRKKVARYGAEAAHIDMRGRHGNHPRGERNHRWKGGGKQKANLPKPARIPAPVKSCACGCGATVKSGTARYAPGHNLRTTEADVVARFWAKVRKGDGCWEWQASRNSSGYGWFRFGPQGSRTPTGAHRVSYVLTKGPIPEGMQVLHRCDNPPCVNPSHLFLGTNDDNHADKVAKGRHPNSRMEKCRPYGHPFDDANTYITPEGCRACRACARLRWRRYARQKGGA